MRRSTSEVEIRLNLVLDGEGRSKIKTGIGFFDHMLTTLCKHALFDIEIEASGQLAHHLIEDVALALGEALAKALGDKKGIRRFGWAYVPMDDSLARAAVDLSGRSYPRLELPISHAVIEDMKAEDIHHFFSSLAQGAKANIHLSFLYGENDHHKVEASVKALALALREAVSPEPRMRGSIPSTKGML